ncbi:hypothetical protein TNCV_5044511 [Trichonephila clavipes]|uniref:Uncharacterized protein n=1 Tax=Trichonephila clavipes TaxID=2585209 RepID=A0A8X6WJ54_TRICX|nr:hypothetical protein TNCV_5044511 [Trichonephila clavipes]
MHRRIFHTVDHGIFYSRDTDRPLEEEKMELDDLSTVAVETTSVASVPTGFRPLPGSTPKKFQVSSNFIIIFSNQSSIWGLSADPLNQCSVTPSPRTGTGP